MRSKSLMPQRKTRVLRFGINLRDDRQSARDFIADREVAYPSIYDFAGATLAAWKVPTAVLPTTIILDRKHRPAVVFLKALTTDELILGDRTGRGRRTAAPVIELAPQAAVGDTFADVVSSGPLLLALGACVLAGLVSFASPCVVPLVPGYLSYLAGLVGAEAPAVKVGEAAKQGRTRVAIAAGLFVAGFTVVFVAATATVLGVTSTFVLNHDLLQRIGGVVTIVMGLVFIGLIPMMQHEVRFALDGCPISSAHRCSARCSPSADTVPGSDAGRGNRHRQRYPGATAAKGVLLIVAYCAGLGIPFVVLAFSSAWRCAVSVGCAVTPGSFRSSAASCCWP